jgi:hypothetical protein
MKRALAVAAFVWLPCSLAAQQDEPFGLPLSGEAAETFLRTAQVVDKKALSVGITHSDRYTLTDGTRTARALWKTIDESKPGITNFQGGGFVVDFADSWKHEVASYELDKLVGTELVPPTVERTFDRTTGSLQMWVESAMTEADRKERRISPARSLEPADVRRAPAAPAHVQHRRQEHPQRAERPHVPRLRRRLLARVRELQRPSGREGARALLAPGARAAAGARPPHARPKLGRWLSGRQIAAMLTRRDKILTLVERLVAQKGEEAVIY